ncbi:unnamed protein product [Cladocopium goreaui]|uniref:Uncharacterized protein n=1 Tax=Cladocopium goreaui TaxID=2562237 RepID=A0A9P1DET0_9DINO|nr:unnamed protein product [Cladocopium goreaui]
MTRNCAQQPFRTFHTAAIGLLVLRSKSLTMTSMTGMTDGQQKCQRRCLGLMVLVLLCQAFGSSLGFLGGQLGQVSRRCLGRPEHTTLVPSNMDHMGSREASSGGFFSDPLDGTPYETNETTGALILAVAGAVVVVFFLGPFLQSYFQTISTP